MILVTGGLGFIGTHTVRALLDRGEECLLVQRRPAVPSPLLASADIAIERADVADEDALRALGRRYPITGIIHLAGSMPWPADPSRPIEQARRAVDSWFVLMRLAEECGVRRVGLASTIGVYAGSPSDEILHEDDPLSLGYAHVIPAFKKVSELLAGHIDAVTDLEVVNYRISATWGPLGHLPDPFFAAPTLAHAAARGIQPDLSYLRGGAHAEDSIDLCYVKDTGRAIAALQTAPRLRHRTYNVASGRATSNAEIIAGIARVAPDARIELPTGGAASNRHLDISRLLDDTDYRPAWDLDRATADYVEWFRAGHDR